MPKLAQAARVSIPTVYRDFPTMDALLRTFLEWLRSQIRMSPERLSRVTPDELPSVPRATRDSSTQVGGEMRARYERFFRNVIGAAALHRAP